MTLPFVLSLVAAGCSPPADPPAPAPAPQATPREVPVRPPAALEAALGEPVVVEGRDLQLRVGAGPGVVLLVPYLSARLVPAGELVDLGDRDSFVLHIDAVEVRIPSQSLQGALAALDAEGGGPLRDLALTADEDTFTLAGRARLLGAGVALRADPQVTDAGELVLHLEEVSVLGVGVKGLLKAVRGPVERAVESRGTLLDLRGEQLHVDPFAFARGAVVDARFTSAHIEGGALVARLGERPTAPGAPGLTLRGGVLRRGGTILFDPHLHLVPQEPGGALEVVPARFPEQLAAGFTKVGGGRIEMHLGSPSEL